MSVTQSAPYARLLVHLGIKEQLTYRRDVTAKTFFPRGYDLFVLDDVLGTLKERNIKRVLENLYKSGVRFAAITNYPAEKDRLLPIDGISRRVNLAHYGMRPLIMMSDGDHGKTLTLYRISNGRTATAK